MIRGLLGLFGGSIRDLSGDELMDLFGGPDRVVELLLDGFRYCSERQKERLRKSFLGDELVVRVKKLRADAILPEKISDVTSGYDVYASRILDVQTREIISDLPFAVKPGKCVLVGVGTALDVPLPYQCEILPPNGFTDKLEVVGMNLMVADFRSELGVLLRNRSRRIFIIGRGMNVAQLIFIKTERPKLKEVVESEAVRTIN